ncbi:type I restriction enzyme specificity protein [Fructobacillus ficulneus]|uniref:Type I restriction enzyme specificity protein n=1 Tax=Fructobacillus ficulneus TaxID=157463 RepID=A0A0K8MHE1_9LACO|nr:type I restriction enzyme specificity protein [Fructobacillus ficulneus]
MGEVSSSFSGGTPSASKKEYYGGNIPFIRSAEINSDSTQLFITQSGLDNSSAKLVKFGDILYAMYGATSGEVGISRINGAINQAILSIRVKGNYSSLFLHQWLKSNKDKIIDKYLQGGQGNLSGSIVKNLEILFPKKDEQEKIGNLFRGLDNLITLHQRNKYINICSNLTPKVTASLNPHPDFLILG